ncbi:MAG: hypothetical protein J6T74_05040 [Clostridia bacterium]|nr:hypothetical protein [Clostridia bacterium]
MNLKNIIGKKVYSVYEGDTVGTVMSANFNNSFKKISSLIVFDDEDDEYCLPLSSVMAMGDGIIIKNRTKLRDLHEIRNIGIICKEVFDENAKNLGIIDDVEFDLQGNIEKYITNNKTELDPAFVIFRKGFILYSKNKIVISNLRPRKKNIDLKTIKVKVFNIKDIKENSFLPSKLQYNPQSILGKIAKGDLVGLNNEIIIKTNQTITEKTILDATKHNRLNQLYYLAN